MFIGLKCTRTETKCQLEGSPEQIEHLLSLAAESAHARANCDHPLLEHENKLDKLQLKALIHEWFT